MYIESWDQYIDFPRYTHLSSFIMPENCKKMETTAQTQALKHEKSWGDQETKKKDAKKALKAMAFPSKR